MNIAIGLVQIQLFLANHPFAELAVIVGMVLIVTALVRLMKQPLIIGYIVAGILVSPNVLHLLQSTTHIETFSHIGVSLLLFMVGLGLNPHVVKDLGKPSLVVGIGQILFTTIVGIGLSLILGFELIPSIYISLALAFSSTIIIVKLLSDKGVLDEIYGKISVGMLIVQDIVAMLLLMLLSSLPSSGVMLNRPLFIGVLVGKLVVVGLIAYVVTVWVLPHITRCVAKSPEFLFLFAIGRCLLWAAGMDVLGFSLEIGALIAGLTMASLPYRFEISSYMKPLRDFFIVLFFVLLGSQLQFNNISMYMISILVFSLFVLIGNPFIVMTLMGIMGYKKKTGMMVGFTVAQISEFSFILIGLAFSIGHITDVNIVSLVTIVGLITIAGSSYYFTYADQIYARCKKYLKVFEKSLSQAEQKIPISHETYEVIVFGNHRTGASVVHMLQKNKKKFIIVDYDPAVISKLSEEGIPCRYGDAGNIDFLDTLPLQDIKMLISTIHDYETNMLLLQKSKLYGSSIVTILSASNVRDAEGLYEHGAEYVLVPHIVGGHHTAMLIEQYEYDLEKYIKNQVAHRLLLQNVL